MTASMNSILIVDYTSIDIINTIGHDLSNYRLTNRKQKFVDLPEIREFVNTISDNNKQYFLAYISDNNKQYFLAYICGLFFENRSDNQFSIEMLNKRISEILDSKSKFNNSELTDDIIKEFECFFIQKRILK